MRNLLLQLFTVGILTPRQRSVVERPQYRCFFLVAPSEQKVDPNGMSLISKQKLIPRELNRIRNRLPS
jgi:hypothetical protein